MKPEMATDEDLAECGPWAQLLAVRILNHADDEGYFKAHEALIRAACFPLVTDESLNVRRAIDELSNIGYIELCAGADGKQYGRVKNFSQHQRVDRSKPSKIKELCGFNDESRTDRRSIDDQSTQEQGTGNREQGTGNGGDGAEPEAGSDPEFLSMLLNDKTEYAITEAKVTEFEELYPAVDVRQELRTMKAWCINNPKKRKTRSGVLRFVNSWLSKEQDKGGYRRPAPQPQTNQLQDFPDD